MDLASSKYVVSVRSGMVNHSSLVAVAVAAAAAAAASSVGCSVRRRAVAEVVIPSECIDRFEKKADTECRYPADGSGEMVCRHIDIIRKQGCEKVAPIKEKK